MATEKETQALIDALNEDLSGELSAITQYITYAAKAVGPFRPQLVSFYTAEIPDEQGHATFLANKVVALGGEPVTVARPVKAAKSNRQMLEAVLEAEKQAVADYTARAKQADELGFKGLTIELENIISDETSHAEETERMLREWPID